MKFAPCTVRASAGVPCTLILPFLQAVASCPSWLGQQTDTIASKVALVEAHLRLLLDSAASGSEMADTDPPSGPAVVLMKKKKTKKPKANSMSVTGAGSGTDGSGSRRQAAHLFLGFPGLLSVSADKVRFCIIGVTKSYVLMAHFVSGEGRYKSIRISGLF